jgi:GT2 family glycosyltransferase
VVDNGSSDGTRAAVERLCQSSEGSISLVHEPRPGVSAARNAGVRRAQSDLVLFVNDDTRPADPRVVVGHVEAHSQSPEPVAIGGRIEYEHDQDQRPFMHWLNQGAQFAYGRLSPGGIPYEYLYSAHLSVSRRVFLDVGGMDERIVFGYEDAVLGVRLSAARIALVYRPDLLLLHDHPMTLRAWKARASRMGAAGHHVNRLIPRYPPIARVPRGPRWWVLRAAAPLLAHDVVEHVASRTAVGPYVFKAVNAGSFAAGYQRARRTGDAVAWGQLGHESDDPTSRCC